MIRRVVALLLTGARCASATPPGVDGEHFAAALAEDVFTVFGELDDVEEAIAFSPENAELAATIAWPGTLLLAVPSGAPLTQVLTELGEAGYTQGAVVAADAPDLPALHLAKTFSALSSSAVAAAPAFGGGLVVLASRLPPSAELDCLDLDGAVAAGVRLTPPWRRLRSTADLRGLDPGLGGWEATRTLLARRQS